MENFQVYVENGLCYIQVQRRTYAEVLFKILNALI